MLYIMASVEIIILFFYQCLQDTKMLLRRDIMEHLMGVIDEECKLFLKYLSDESFISSLASTWKPDVEVISFNGEP